MPISDVRLPVRHLADEIHNIQCVINALCFDTVEFDLSHISGEQVANGDLYAMEDLLEILTDVYHWIKNDRQQPEETGKKRFETDEANPRVFQLVHFEEQLDRSTPIDQAFTHRLSVLRLLNSPIDDVLSDRISLLRIVLSTQRSVPSFHPHIPRHVPVRKRLPTMIRWSEISKRSTNLFCVDLKKPFICHPTHWIFLESLKVCRGFPPLSSFAVIRCFV